MATKNYLINDKWLDIDKQNIVELQSVDGEIDSLKVNGSEIETPSGKITITENGTDIDIAQYALADVNVEGGGGSSDFSTAEVTFTVAEAQLGNYDFYVPYIEDDEFHDIIVQSLTKSDIYIVPLYKDGLVVLLQRQVGVNASVSGDAILDEDDLVTITGDCTITIS